MLKSRLKARLLPRYLFRSRKKKCDARAHRDSCTDVSCPAGPKISIIMVRRSCFDTHKEEVQFMRSLIGTFALGVLLLLSASCSKPNSNQPSDNTAQNPDNTAAQPAADNSQQPAPQARVPVTITVPAGKVLTVRLADELGSKISQAGQSFGGTLAKPVEVNGETVIPAGARVQGEVVDAKPLGRFAGGAQLQLKLDSVRVGGQEMPIQTAMFTQTLKGKGKRTG